MLQGVRCAACGGGKTLSRFVGVSFPFAANFDGRAGPKALLDRLADRGRVALGTLCLLLTAGERKRSDEQRNDSNGDAPHGEPPQNVCGMVWFEYAGKSMSCVK
jgi:hypothetical protein